MHSILFTYVFILFFMLSMINAIEYFFSFPRAIWERVLGYEAKGTLFWMERGVKRSKILLAFDQ